MKKKPKSAKSNKPVKDPLFGLKYLAYLRTGLPVNDEDLDEEALIVFAKWQICKIRNRLWLDPIWDTYTQEEILIEYFAIKFDENEELRKKFEISMVGVKDKDLDWLDKMTKKYSTEKDDKISKGQDVQENQAVVDEFEDKF